MSDFDWEGAGFPEDRFAPDDITVEEAVKIISSISADTSGALDVVAGMLRDTSIRAHALEGVVKDLSARLETAEGERDSLMDILGATVEAQGELYARVGRLERPNPVRRFLRWAVGLGEDR